MKKLETCFLFIIIISIWVVGGASIIKAEKGLKPIPYDNPRAHQEWFYGQRAYPGEIKDIPWIERWKAVEKLKAEGYFQNTDVDDWVCNGPFNLGGRTIALWADDSDSDYLLAGAADGGVWKTTDGGGDWIPLSDNIPSMAVGAIAVNPIDKNIIYIGTGEGTFNADAVKGVGVLKSIDRGLNWEMTGLDWDITDGNGTHGLWIKSDEPQTIVAATTGGVYRSVDGGDTWTLTTAGDGTALVGVSNNPNIVFLAKGNAWGNGANGIYRSMDAGSTWEHLTNGLPPTSQIGFTSLAISKNNPDYIYAGFATIISSGAGLLGIYRSTDGGDTWELRADSPNFYGGQGWYDNVIAVDPNNPDIVYAGGIDLYRSFDGGQSWQQISWWYYSIGDPSYVHADQHAFAIDPNDNGHIWAAGDGGIFTSFDAGTNWEMRNTNFCTLQYYAIGNAPQNDYIVYGGSQDQGTTKWSGTGDWDYVYGGDGGYCVIDYKNYDVVYAEWQNGNHVKTNNGGGSWFDIMNGIEEDGAWVTPVIMDPLDNGILFTATDRVYKTDDGASYWEPVSPHLSASIVSLSQSPTDPDIVWVGLSNGLVWKGDPSSQEWEELSSGLPNRYCTRVVADPINPLVAYATYSGYGNSVVFRTSDGGLSWDDITGDLPLLPVNDLAIDPSNTSNLFIANDITIMHSTDLGSHWEPYGNGLPNVFIDDILIDSFGNLRAGTHGRGMWSTSVLSSVSESQLDNLPYDFRIDAPKPNPFNPGARIGFALKKNGQVKIDVINILGQKVRTLIDGRYTSGFHTVIWDGKDNSGEPLSTGVYLFRMEFGGKIRVTKGTMVK